jgi:Rhodopirellula transposase DDE domain
MAAVESLARRYEALRPHLTERQRRLWLGSEARELGRGGAAVVAAAVGVAADTVRRGRDELDAPQPPAVGRSRKPGGGRKRAEFLDGGLPAALEALIDPVTRGDPESPLRWTTKSLRALAKALREQGHQVSEFVVRRLLIESGYSLQANAKTAEGGNHVDRDAQFGYLNSQVKDHQRAGCPVISTDAKKKELVGIYKNAGAEWRPKGEPEQVNVYDFINKDLGKVTPYGVYDVTANTGWVSVGTDHDTAAFAVATIEAWWASQGRHAYPGANRLLITADGGGSNGYRTRLWKTELAGLAARTGLTITVCHFPPGTSKWNTIEHRLFSHISINWRARPLTSHEVIVKTIAATTTRTGLRVHAELDQNTYPTGVKIPDQDMKALDTNGILTRHDFHGEWNYSLNPDPTAPPRHARPLRT